MRQVVAIHGQKIIESLEVLPGDLATTQSAQIVTAACRSCLRPWVGRIAYVIVEVPAESVTTRCESPAASLDGGTRPRRG
jgi:hypothetical protein